MSLEYQSKNIMLAATLKMEEVKDNSYRESRKYAEAPDVSRKLPGGYYEYTALDMNAPSIRLIRIEPGLSPKGHIQCSIRHASTDSTYTCLSYVWGPRSAGSRLIELNGRKNQIRENLFQFLCFARRKPHLCDSWFWIDALCIDQENLAERTHQVQQMGEIYSRAERIVSWLGPYQQIASFLADAASKGRSGAIPPVRMHAFYSSEYWNRAWITQEVVLARRVVLMAKNRELPFEQLPVHQLNDALLVSRVHSLRPDTHDQIGRYRGLSLIHLLDLFRDKTCAISVDRVFSLLAICGDGASLCVDYTLPRDDFEQTILRHCSKSFCICSVQVIYRAVSARQLILPKSTILRSSLVDTDAPFAWITLVVLPETFIPRNIPSGRISPAQNVSDMDGRRMRFSCDFDQICDEARGRLFVTVYLSKPAFACNYYGSKSLAMNVSPYTAFDEGTRLSYLANSSFCLLRENGTEPRCELYINHRMLQDLALVCMLRAQGCCRRVRSVRPGTTEPSSNRLLTLCPEV